MMTGNTLQPEKNDTARLLCVATLKIAVKINSKSTLPMVPT
jgi:hypothetical protein